MIANNELENYVNILVRQEGKCVFITGEKQNLIKLTDDYLFKIIGVR